jgi:hypothetical protein
MNDQVNAIDCPPLEGRRCIAEWSRLAAGIYPVEPRRTDSPDPLALPGDVCEHAFRRLEMAQTANELFSIVTVPLPGRPLLIDTSGWQ